MWYNVCVMVNKLCLPVPFNETLLTFKFLANTDTQGKEDVQNWLKLPPTPEEIAFSLTDAYRNNEKAYFKTLNGKARKHYETLMVIRDSKNTVNHNQFLFKVAEKWVDFIDDVELSDEDKAAVLNLHDRIKHSYSLSHAAAVWGFHLYTLQLWRSEGKLKSFGSTKKGDLYDDLCKPTPDDIAKWETDDANIINEKKLTYFDFKELLDRGWRAADVKRYFKKHSDWFPKETVLKHEENGDVVSLKSGFFLRIYNEVKHLGWEIRSNNGEKANVYVPCVKINDTQFYFKYPVSVFHGANNDFTKFAQADLKNSLLKKLSLMKAFDLNELQPSIEDRDFKKLDDIVERYNLKQEILVQASKNNVSFHYLDNIGINKNKKIVFYSGPTNSGKTYSAIQEVKTGNCMYLGPLRLLALEITEKMTELGVPCSLVTGEEIKLIPGSKMSARTVEMADFDNYYDTIIIDEAQFITDKDRGWAWINAIALCKADTIILTGPSWAEASLRNLCNILELDLSVKKFQRRSVLSVKYCDNWRNIQNGSIVVGFSREMVLQISDLYRSIGKTTAVVYGALSPSVRAEQARLFREGHAELLIATDAVGMGLNLPAENVVFWETSKFDGNDVRELENAEVQQIAGRAGRDATNGFAIALSRDDFSFIEHKLEGKVQYSEEYFVAPTISHLRVIAPQVKNRLSDSIAFFESFVSDIFKPFVAKRSFDLALFLDNSSSLSLEEKWILCRAPVNDDTLPYWKELCLNIKKTLPFPDKPPYSLEGHEQHLKELDLLSWVSLRFQGNIDVSTLREESNSVVNKFLSKSASRGGKGSRKVCTCKRVLLPYSNYTKCRDCAIFDNSY